MGLRETTPQDVAAWIDLRRRQLIKEKQSIRLDVPMTKRETIYREAKLQCIYSKLVFLSDLKKKVLTIDAV